jgi:hypothetical protein
MATLGVNVDNVEPDAGRGAFQAGRYVLQITESDVVDTKEGTGKLLKLTFEVFEGPMAKRRIWDQLNIQNASVQAQEIGQKQLSALIKALRLPTTPADSQDMHFIPFEAEVGFEPAGPDKHGVMRKERNTIKRYIFEDGGAAPAPAAPQPARAAVARPAASAKPAGTRPWATARA